MPILVHPQIQHMNGNEVDQLVSQLVGVSVSEPPIGLPMALMVVHITKDA